MCPKTTIKNINAQSIYIFEVTFYGLCSSVFNVDFEQYLLSRYFIRLNEVNLFHATGLFLYPYFMPLVSFYTP